MFRKTLLLAAAMILMAFPGIAAAQGYGTANFLSVSDTTPVPGQTIVISGCCFEGTVAVDFESEPQRLAETTPGSTGELSLSATIPADAALGTHSITATGEALDGSETLKLSAPITVVAASASGGAAARGEASTGGASGNLPRTGAESTFPLVQLGVALVLAGGGLLLALRNRRAASLRRRSRLTVDA